MATKLGRTVPWEAPTHEVTWPFGHMALQDHVTSHYIFTTTKTMATTLGQIVTYLEPLLPLVKSSWKTSWQFKTIISSLPQCPWPPNLLGWWLTLMGSYHIVMTFNWVSTTLTPTKLGRHLTLGRFSMEMLQSSQTSCYWWLYHKATPGTYWQNQTD